MTIPTTERHNYWQQQVDNWKASGLSGPKFCLANNLTYHCFVYWRRKLTATSTGQSPEVSSGGFVKVNMTTPTDESLIVSLPSGVVIRGIAAENITVVQQLLAIL
jgi:hypothetical protein